MAEDILSQEEVDALLQDSSQSEEGEGQSAEQQSEAVGPKEGDNIEPYDFRRPKVLAPRQLKGLQNLHEDLLPELNRRLTMTLRTQAQLKVSSLASHQYGDFIDSLNNTTHLILFSVRPLPGVAVLEMNLPLVFGMVDLLAGGNGDTDTSERKMTDLEYSIVEVAEDELLEGLRGTWSDVVDVGVDKVRYETDPEAVQAAPSDAPVVVVTLDVEVENASGTLNFCYPLPMVQTLLRNIQEEKGQAGSFYGAEMAEESSEKIINRLMDVPLVSGVELGNATITASELLSLEEGDVIVLNRRISSPLPLSAEDWTLFEAIPGVNNDTLCVKVLRSLLKQDKQEEKEVSSVGGAAESNDKQNGEVQNG